MTLRSVQCCEGVSHPRMQPDCSCYVPLRTAPYSTVQHICTLHAFCIVLPLSERNLCCNLHNALNLIFHSLVVTLNLDDDGAKRTLNTRQMAPNGPACRESYTELTRESDTIKSLDTPREAYQDGSRTFLPFSLLPSEILDFGCPSPWEEQQKREPLNSYIHQL